MEKIFHAKKILVTGGTGSLGSAMVSRLMSGRDGKPRFIRILSRDEGKQYFMRNSLLKRQFSSDPEIEFRLGDVRDYPVVASAARGMDIIIHAAALKHVPACERNVEEATLTNVLGSQNVVYAAGQHESQVSHVLGISTDKACLPMSAMGMTKALMERVFKDASRKGTYPKFICVRMGNILMSRGSVVPLFREQIKAGGPVTLTHPAMTRFFIPIGTATDYMVEALALCKSGDIYVPAMRSVNIEKLALIMMGLRMVPIEHTGIRTGEKLHDMLINKHESRYARALGSGWAIDLSTEQSSDPVFDEWEYHSGQEQNFMPLFKLEELLRSVENG